MQRRTLIHTALASTAFAFSGLAPAQDFPPKKAVTMVVGFAAGGAADAAARLIAKKLGENIGQTVVVDNKGGAGGNIAHGQVANAATDGSVILFGSVGPLTIAPHLMKLNYDPFKDLAPISGGVNFPNVLVVHKGAGVKTLKEFVALAKKSPGSVDYASSGAASASHLAGELFNQRAGVEMVHVPYKGGAPALTDVMAGQVDMYFGNAASTLQYLNGGKLRALAVSSRKRVQGLDNVPTLRESGMPEFEVLEWNGVFLPKNTPKDIVELLGKATREAVADAGVRERLMRAGLEPVGNSAQEFSAFIKAESARWQAVVKARNIKLD